MLESMIVELNAGEALPTLSRKGWERVGSDGNAPFNLCEKIAKRMKAGDALISSSFPEIYSITSPSRRPWRWAWRTRCASGAA